MWVNKVLSESLWKATQYRNWLEIEMQDYKISEVENPRLSRFDNVNSGKLLLLWIVIGWVSYVQIGSFRLVLRCRTIFLMKQPS